jgi:hypothetical protein
MRNASILVLVDAQRRFVPADHDAVHRMADLIREAIRLRQPVITNSIPYFSPLDEEGCGPVHASLLELLNGYDLHVDIVRTVNSYYPFELAARVLQQCKDHGWIPQNFIVGGAWTGGWLRDEKGEVKQDSEGPAYTGCVFDCVYGLFKLGSGAPIEVVKDACYDGRRCFQVKWGDYEGLPSVRVI